MFWKRKAAAALVLVLALASPAAAERESSRFPPEADDYISMTSDELEDGDLLFLHQPVFYTRQGAKSSTTVRVRIPRGEYLNVQTDRGGVTVTSKPVRDTQENYWGESYDYCILHITPHETETMADQAFRLKLQITGLSVLLEGKTAAERVAPLLSAMKYDVTVDGAAFEFQSEIDEEEAVVQFPKGLTVAFLGDYGKDKVNLQASVLEEDGTVRWAFSARPSFDTAVTVRLNAPEDARVYEIYGGKRTAIKTKYLAGNHTFMTQGLTAYELVF